jgi:serine/threonine-protein kinase
MRQVLRGLETLHEMGFVHSDIKPANIMIDRLGYVKLVDYGRAVMANEKVNILFGTPMYMAPETHRREASLVQSDIYSVGLVGLEMLRGEPLLVKKRMSEADLVNFKQELPRLLPDLLPEYVRQNAQFVLLLQRFLEVEPNRRYPSAEEAEVGSQGLLLVHKQLAQLGKDTEYGRELENYLSKLMAPLPGAQAHQETDVAKTELVN